MINLEAGSILFRDGVRVPDSEIGPRTYPSSSLPECEIRLRMGVGTIFAMPNEPDKFVSHLRDVYMTMVKQLVGTKYEKYHSEYYASELTAHVKVSKAIVGPAKPPMITVLSDSMSPPEYIAPQCSERFRWRLATQTSFEFTRGTSLSITNHMCSIFYDHCSILTLPHDTFIPLLTPEHCVRNPSVLHTPSILTFSNYYVPMLYQYKMTKWRGDRESRQWTPSHRTPSVGHHRSLPTVYRFEGSGAGVPSSAECAECKSIVVGDHYVVYTSKPAVKSTTYCAPCLHTDANARKILSSSTVVFRRASILSPERYLEMNEKSAVVKEIYREAMAHGVRSGVYGVFIGEKYYAVEMIGAYLLGGQIDEIPAGVQVINGVLIH